jgi:hypothetical protein
VHHAGEIVHAANVGNALLDVLPVVLYPLDDDGADGFVDGLAAVEVLALLLLLLLLLRRQVERGSGDLEGKGGLEGGLGPGVEVDAQLLERGRGRELWVDARRGRLEQRQLSDVALRRLEELVRPGALERGQLRGREEALEAVVEVYALRFSRGPWEGYR